LSFPATIPQKVDNRNTFIVSPYYANQDNVFYPVFPKVGICHFVDKRPCKLCIDHKRDRKTGPHFHLFVLRCTTHKKGFTIYPPGYTPYGRQPLVPVGPDGSPLINKEGLHLFNDTFFDAALDASEGEAWPHEYNDEIQKPRFITQSRHLKRASLLLGIQSDLNENDREVISQVLGVPGQVMLDNANRIKGQSTYRIVGDAICEVLDAIPQSSSLFESMALAGSISSLWPTPTLWDEKGNYLRQPSFQFAGTRSPPE